MIQDIYSYVKEQETLYETQDIQVGDNWNWNMRDHIQLLFHLKNGVFYTGENDWLRSFKEVMAPMIELSNWTEDLEVKDATFYIEGKDDRIGSFLIKKYHDEVYTRKHDLDYLFDEITESDNTYGGTLVQKAPYCPEVIKLKRIAFCDQTNVLGGSIGFKHNFSPDALRGMKEYGWGDESNGATISIEELIVLAEQSQEIAGSDKKNTVTGKTIEAYIIRGSMPSDYLNDDGDMDNWFSQLQIIAYYLDKEGKRQGVTLYRKKADEGDLKFFTSTEVEDRGLGRGVGEKLIHPQIWTNFLSIHKMNMLEAGSKVPLYTDDSTYTSKNRIQDMENLEITTIEENKRIYQVPTVAPANVQLFEQSINEWYTVAQNNASAFDSLMGKEESSGSTFRGQERLVAQGRGPHDRKRGKRAKFIEEIYRDWIIPDMKKEIVKGKKFLGSLTSEELNWVADRWATNQARDRVVNAMFDGKFVSKEEQDALITQYKQDFLKSGSKKLIEIAKDELKDIEIGIGINIAGKQKNLANLSDKILSIFQFVFANVQGFQQAMQVPALSKAFEDILEFSGLSSADFNTFINTPIPQPQLALPQQTNG